MGNDTLASAREGNPNLIPGTCIHRRVTNTSIGYLPCEIRVTLDAHLDTGKEEKCHVESSGRGGVMM